MKLRYRIVRERHPDLDDSFYIEYTDKNWFVRLLTGWIRYRDDPLIYGYTPNFKTFEEAVKEIERIEFENNTTTKKYYDYHEPK